MFFLYSIGALVVGLMVSIAITATNTRDRAAYWGIAATASFMLLYALAEFTVDRIKAAIREQKK